jgi:hypothetical protein
MTEGVVVLTGGGFKRLDRQTTEQRIRKELQSFGNITTHLFDLDTKYLTLAGLSRMAKLSKPDEGGGGEDISQRHPGFWGGHLLTNPAASDETWYAAMDTRRSSV